MNETMTDYQFKTVLKMVKEILNASGSIEEAKQKIDELIDIQQEDKRNIR
jgi:hypothetical protein